MKPAEECHIAGLTVPARKGAVGSPIAVLGDGALGPLPDVIFEMPRISYASFLILDLEVLGQHVMAEAAVLDVEHGERLRLPLHGRHVPLPLGKLVRVDVRVYRTSAGNAWVQCALRVRVVEHDKKLERRAWERL